MVPVVGMVARMRTVGPRMFALPVTKDLWFTFATVTARPTPTDVLAEDALTALLSALLERWLPDDELIVTTPAGPFAMTVLGFGVPVGPTHAAVSEVRWVKASEAATGIDWVPSRRPA